MGALLGAVLLLSALLMVGVKSLAPVTVGDASMRPSQPNLSNQAKTMEAAAPFEIDVPYMGSIETPLDAGSIWDEEARPTIFGQVIEVR